jgi:predicted nucleic acid-binding protein
MLVDTDVMIWFLRGHSGARLRLNQLSALNISVMTWLELLQGFRNNAEKHAVQKSLHLRRAVQIPFIPAISNRAVLLMEALTMSHGMQSSDALIAATALEHDLTLLTGNVKDFSPVPGLKIEAFKP